jgi:hypothetical protein
MSHSGPKFPFFIPIPARSLNEREVAVVARLVKGQASRFAEQLGGLQVVGRCGCGACPTVFFLPHRQGDSEADLVTMAGKDNSGGLTAAVLLEKAGSLSQLEFYSVDGHEPWEVPDAESLEPW